MGILSVADFKKLASDGNNVIILDARGGADAHERFKAGHIKYAHYVDLETELSHKTDDAANGGRHPLPSPTEFSQFLSEKGITPSSKVVIYDDKNGGNAAARLWWMLTSAGHQQTYVLDGGLQVAVAEGVEVETGETTTVEKSAYIFDSWLKPTVDIDDVARATADDQFLVIDVRENYRFRGESEPIDLVAGHIPGAVNMPYLSNLDEHGKFLSAEALREKYSDVVGNREVKNIFVHCGSGVTACHTLLALSEAGFGDASLYVGSWSEWSRNDRPVGLGDK